MNAGKICCCIALIAINSKRFLFVESLVNHRSLCLAKASQEFLFRLSGNELFLKVGRGVEQLHDLSLIITPGSICVIREDYHRHKGYFGRTVVPDDALWIDTESDGDVGSALHRGMRNGKTRTGY